MGRKGSSDDVGKTVLRRKVILSSGRKVTSQGGCMAVNGGRGHARHQFPVVLQFTMMPGGRMWERRTSVGRRRP